MVCRMADVYIADMSKPVYRHLLKQRWREEERDRRGSRPRSPRSERELREDYDLEEQRKRRRFEEIDAQRSAGGE